MPRLAYKKSLSLGEAISSVCFFGVGVVWLSQGLDMFEKGAYWRSTALFFLALLSFAACLRYTIQNTLYKIFVGFDQDDKSRR